MTTDIRETTKQVILASYNMSYASDKGWQPGMENNLPSEASFLMTNPELYSNPRAYWLNAKNRLKEFINMYGKQYGLMIGLQEMNKTESGTGKLEGTAAIEDMLRKEITNGIKYDSYSASVTTSFGTNPSLMTIWDRDNFGSADDSTCRIYDLDKKAAGRPILFVYTTNGYLLINLHNVNDAKGSAEGYISQKKLIQDRFTEFLTDIIGNGNYAIPAEDKIFVVGDFNDRFNGLGRDDGTTVLDLSYNDRTYNLKFNGQPPKSCCHNIDSSCEEGAETETPYDNTNAVQCKYTANYSPAGPFREIEGFRTTTDNLAQNFKRNNQIYINFEQIMDKKKEENPEFIPKQIRVQKPEETWGNVGNYRYYGDYCFASKGGVLRIYQDVFTSTLSQASDHEMVYLIVGETQDLPPPPGPEQVKPPQPPEGGRIRRRRMRTRKHRRTSRKLRGGSRRQKARRTRVKRR